MKQQFEMMYSKAKETIKTEASANHDGLDENEKDNDENFIKSGLDALKNIQSTITKVATGDNTKQSRKRTWTHFFRRNAVSYIPKRVKKGLKKADPLRDQKKEKKKADYIELAKALYDAQTALENGDSLEAIKILREAPRVQNDYVTVTASQVAARERKVDEEAKRQVSKIFKYQKSESATRSTKIPKAVSDMIHDVCSLFDTIATLLLFSFICVKVGEIDLLTHSHHFCLLPCFLLFENRLVV